MDNDGESLRLCHFSDLHYSPGHLAESDRCFGFAVEHAIETGCEVAVVSGDSTDHRLDAHTPALAALARRIHQLSSHMPVVMIQGTFSHEPPGTLDIFGLIGERHRVYVADRIHQVALCGGTFVPSVAGVFTAAELQQLIVDEGEPEVVFTCVPTVNKAVLASAVGVTLAPTALGDHLSAYLEAAGVVNQQLRRMGIRTVGISHGTVNGCQTEHGVPMAGFDHEFTIGALFEANCDAFMLGHIHRAQQWEREGRVVAYPGSIGRFHYGELGDKGYLKWEVSAGRASASLVPTPARETVCLDFDGPPDMERLAAMAEEAAGKFVRLRWTVDEEHRQVIDREAITALFGKSADLKLEARVLPAVRSRAEGISRETSLPEKLARWGELTAVDTNPLLERLTMLQTLDAESIVERVLAHLDVGDASSQLNSVADVPEASPPTAIGEDKPHQPATPPEKSGMDWLTDDLFADASA